MLAQGCSEELMSSFENAIRQECENQYEAKIEALQKHLANSRKQSNGWRLKYFAADEKRQEFEHLVVVLEKKIARNLQTIVKLSSFIKLLRKQIFGEKSERSDKTAAAKTASDDGSPTTKPKRGKQKGTPGSGRKPDEGLKPVPVLHDLAPADKVCTCGQDYELTDLPAVTSSETHILEKCIVRQHVRRKAVRKCTSCGNNPGIAIAPAPPKLIRRSKYSTEFWRYVLEEKFWLQRPTNRVIRKLKSLGVIARPGTINNGFHLLYKSTIFESIYDSIVLRSKIAEQRHMDETGWKVFAESEEKESSRWYMWVSLTSDTTVFILDPSKSNEVIHAHLSGIAEGIIICDRASSFKCFGKRNPGFLIAFCWVHQRRDFIKLRDGYPEHASWANEWITRMDALTLQNKLRLNAVKNSKDFKVEDKLLRKMIRKFEKRFEEQIADKSLAEERLACVKSLREHWSGLTVFVNFPHVPMSNNDAERALRNAVLGRKSYYGSRSEWSGTFASWMFTIYATLEQNGIDPVRWMNEYLTVCAKNDGCTPSDEVLEKFLPWNYKLLVPDLNSAPNIDSSDDVTEQNRLTISFLPECTSVSATWSPDMTVLH